ncbi:hypothetical protein ACF3MZ_10495 [Paenibacillaceae bacterium WGS1546]|uniref:hypothetical protein n=1 Tax=Cohnella sp. WGS1546 TaxID=3366810 RepID=UPI00372D4124
MNNKLLNNFESFIEFVKSIDDITWSKPIAPGKWTVKDVIAHLWNWDVYTLDVMLPRMKNNAELSEFIDHMILTIS